LSGSADNYTTSRLSGDERSIFPLFSCRVHGYTASSVSEARRVRKAMGGKKILGAVLVTCAILTGKAVAQQDEATSYYGPRLIEEKVKINAREGYTIAATVLRPEGAGPYGAVILNHGVAGSRRERLRESSDLLIDA